MAKEKERGQYYINIEFTNGSDPYGRYEMTMKELRQELKKWEKNYNMELQLISILGGYYYKATEKCANVSSF